MPDLFVTKAQAIYAEMAKDPDLALDPTPPAPGTHPILDALIALMKQFLPLLLTCLPLAAAHTELKKLSRPRRLQFRLGIRRKLHDDETFHVFGRAIEDATLKVAADTSKSELTTMHEAL